MVTLAKPPRDRRARVSQETLDLDDGGPAGDYRLLPVDLIEAHPDNPRSHWDSELVPSVRARGVLQPIVVRPRPGRDGERYQLVAGERRLRAARAAGLAAVPAMIRELDDAAALVEMLLENVQRRDLNAIEKARLLTKLCGRREDGGAGQKPADLAALFGKSRPWAVNLMRLLKLPEAWQAKVADGQLSGAHARLLVPHCDAPDVLAAVERDMAANPWAWGTREQFERSLGLLVANPAGDSSASAPIGAPRAVPASRRIGPKGGEPDGDDDGPGGGHPAALPSAASVDAICKAVATLDLAGVERVGAALDARREALAPAKRLMAPSIQSERPRRRKAVG